MGSPHQSPEDKQKGKNSKEEPQPPDQQVKQARAAEVFRLILTNSPALNDLRP